VLSVEALEAGYGAAQVLFGVSFSIAAGEVVTFLGRNGMG
jgi:branched-chain amino acid transport system ATP-binding protein